jgi:acyl-CoA thioesterase-1
MADTEVPVILVLGDSLSAGYGLEMSQAWPSLLAQRLQDNGHKYRVQNASITGETTQGGVGRLPRLLQRHQPAIVIIELGGNDGLRGFSLDVTRANLDAMVAAASAAGAEVILTEIVLPPNYGPTYTERFRGLYGELATQHGALLVPFFMQGVALVDGMIQADGVHPTAAGQPVLLDNVWAVLEPVL